MVADYNAGVETATRRVVSPDGTVTVVRPRTPFNQVINPIVLPDRFSSGDSLITQDLRVTKIVSAGGSRGSHLSAKSSTFSTYRISPATAACSINQDTDSRARDSDRSSVLAAREPPR